MGAKLGRKQMHFYFRDEKITQEEEKKILIKHKSELLKDIFVLILTASDWDDYGFKTDFVAWIHNVKTGIKHGLGTLKVGYKGQPEESWTIHNTKIKNIITNKLDDDFFSMFNSEDSYQAIFNYFDTEYEELIKTAGSDESKEDYIKRNANTLLDGLNDIVYKETIKNNREIIKELVFKNSFLRSTSIETILYSYDDIVHQKNGITNFEINVKGLKFRSTVESKPSNNIHAIIGSNGCGKSYILDLIVDDYVNRVDKRIKKLIIVSFSPFDKLNSYKKYLLKDSDVKINYIGIKDFYIHVNNLERATFEKLKNREEIQKDFIDSFYLAIKKDLKLVHDIFDEIKKSHPDSLFKEVMLDEIINFNSSSFLEYKEMQLIKNSEVNDVIEIDEENIKKNFLERELSNETTKIENIKKFDKLSSGYQLISYTLFNLIAHIERGTVVLYDEPEVYLHPPLMLTYIKLLREIFIRKNGMGIFATHSPIVLQEIPKSCIKVIKRIKEDGNVSSINLRPETYASSITSINNEIFKLETMNSGFYKDIFDACKKVDENEESKDLNEEEKINKVLHGFKNQIGDEGLSVIYDFFYKDEK